jgi:SNARE protein
MADVQYWDDTLTDEVQSIQQLISDAERISSNNVQKASTLDRAEKKLRAAQGTKRSFKMETRLVADPNQRQRYENKLARLSDDLARCANDIKALKGGMQRGELFVGARGNNSSNISGSEMSGVEVGDMMIGEMNNIQDKTKESLTNTKRMVASSKEVGEATMEELLRQREQIRNIDNEAMRIEDNLQRADKLIKAFGKRMATDKLIQCFACINILLLTGVIVYVVIKDKVKPSPAAGAPTNPVGGRFLRGWFQLFDDGDSGTGLQSDSLDHYW